MVKNVSVTAAVAKKLVDQFERAVRADAWKGSQHPGDHAFIEQNLREDRKRLLEALTGVK